VDSSVQGVVINAGTKTIWRGGRVWKFDYRLLIIAISNYLKCPLGCIWLDCLFIYGVFEGHLISMNAPPIQEEEGSFTYSLGVWGKLSVFEHRLLAGMKHVYNRVGWLFLFF
jgi:hypothetical protein